MITDRPLLFTFDGSDSSAGRFGQLYRLAVDNSTGQIYASELTALEHHAVTKFSPDGVALDFAATGESSMVEANGAPFTNFLGIAVDNSASLSQDTLYVSQLGDGRAMRFTPGGEFSCELSGDFLGFQPRDVAVDTAGKLWTRSFGDNGVKTYGSTGCPPAQIPLPPALGDLNNIEGGSALDVDANGNVYLTFFKGGIGTVRRYPGAELFDPGPAANDVFADQAIANGHIFVLQKEFFREYDASGALIGTFGTGGAVGAAEGIAYSNYDPPGAEGPLDRVYVADNNLRVVSVFGSSITGTVPDPTIEATDGIAVGKATFHGMVHPQGVPNGYYFEWTDANPELGWEDASRSPTLSLPEDGSSHAVSFTTGALKGNRKYRVRLVALNTANGLRAASGIVQFTTLKAAKVPPLTIDPVEKDATPPCASGITTTSACISGSINPLEDTVEWRVQRTTDPECASGFADEAVQVLPGEERTTPVLVAFVLEDLVPAQDYCVRILAVNSFGSATSEVREFTTKAVPATDPSTAFASIRLDTSARINARVNPQGAPFTYRFEWRRDDGESWTLLPEREDASRAREQIVISDELIGLQPATTYRYRLAAVENEAGPATGLPTEEGIFTTRDSAETTIAPNAFGAPERGIELVNDPDKGNQHVRTELAQETSPISADGNRALWNVLAGAPNANTGTGGTFLAERTAQGWRSRSLIPVDSEQVGGADTSGYRLAIAPPGLSSLLFNAGVRGAVDGGTALVRLDTEQNPTLLAQFANAVKAGRADMTDDGAHVLFVNPEQEQLEDIGGSTPETVSVMPNGQENKCGLINTDVNNSFVGGGNAAEAAAKQWRPGYHMIATTDASRVYFQAKANSVLCSKSLLGIYQRNREIGQTILIDPGSAGRAPQFIRATPDGRQAYFLTYSNQQTYEDYVDDLPASEDEHTIEFDPDGDDLNGTPDVYVYEEAVNAAECVTCDSETEEGSDVTQANVRFQEGGEGPGGGVLVSDDFSHVYFESTSQHVAGRGEPGDRNIYALSDGVLRFVANLTQPGLVGDTQLAEDGDVLLFRSIGTPDHRELTADPIDSPCVPVSSNQAPGSCRELIRYDDDDGSLECVSCRRTGVTAHSVGSPDNNGNEFAMSADGSTVALVTAERLVAEDVNGSADVYEWRNAALRLVSDGLTTYPEAIVASPQVHAVDADGGDIFFSLVDPDLTGFELDGFANLYDARIGGGFTPTSPPAPCTEDACQGPLQAPPSIAPPASAGFSGRGNVEPPPKKRPCARKQGKRGKQGARARPCARKQRKRKGSHRAGGRSEERGRTR